MCKAHLYTSPFKAKADNCAGDKLINLENEKQSLGGPDRKETR